MSTRRLKYVLHKESGAVLITGLIFMVVLTIIVISALRSATLEERMAANARNRQLALQAAEAVLRDAETALFAAAPFDPFTPASFTPGCTNGLCRKPVAGDPPRWQTIDWNDAGVTRSFASGTSNLSGVAGQPRYFVEIMNTPVLGGGGGICPKILFRITARGVGMDNSTVFVQTMFRHLPASC
ncbi:PilX N-terminal domain-containing pilus assembly protein [Thiobacillus sp.]|uniref:pilus assembly PilX family protein n=1 Tax=Thiobacillus sp. TaxID=924 RepID=UPI0025F1EE02|nr:PilX N-terminal domain-containing pilus assembly protein [Thiobacillus sp.]